MVLTNPTLNCRRQLRGESGSRIGRSRTGFTLVELLVMIGIIGALIAILVPAVFAARSQARCAKCLSNIRQLGLDLRLYATDNHDNYPINVTLPSPAHWSDPERIGRYLPLPRTAMSSSIFWCPADADAQRSYAMNIWASSAADKTVTSSASGKLWPHRRAASSMLLLAEAWSYETGIGTGYVPTPSIGTYGSSAGQRFGSLGGIGPISAGRWGMVNSELAYSRHRQRSSPAAANLPIGRVTVFFDDGHAALCGNADLVDPQTGASSGLAAWSTLDYVRN